MSWRCSQGQLLPDSTRPAEIAMQTPIGSPARAPAGICLPEKREARDSDPLAVPRAPPDASLFWPRVYCTADRFACCLATETTLGEQSLRIIVICGGSMPREVSLIHPRSQHRLAARSTYARKLDRSSSRRAFCSPSSVRKAGSDRQ